MRALIVEDGRTRTALAAVRALGIAGWEVGVASPVASGLAGSSRWVHQKHRTPESREASGLADAVRDVLATVPYDIVFGAGDAEVLVLSEWRAALATCVPYAPHEVVSRTLDKLQLVHAAAGLGLTTPRTVNATPDELARMVFPLIVKSRLHSPAEHPRFEAMTAPGLADASARAAAIRAAGAEPLAQDLIYGDLLSYAVLLDEEREVVAEVQQRAEAVWPPRAGGSVRATTERVNRTLAEQVRALLNELGWFGLAHAQFIDSPADGPFLIDVNGRFYGSMSLATAAGVNFPHLWALLALGRRPHRTAPAQEGRRYHVFERDLRRAIASGEPRIRAVAGVLAYAPGATHDVIRADDLRPALTHARHLLRRLVVNLGRRWRIIGRTSA